MKKIYFVLLMLVIAFSMIAAAPAHEAEAAPVEVPLAVEEDEGLIDWTAAGDSIKNVGVFILVTIGVVLGTERGTEIGKLISRWAAKTKFLHE